MYSALPRYAATRIHMLCSVCIVHSCWFEGKLWRLLRDPLVFIHVVLRLYPLQLQSPLSKINFLFFHRKIMDQIKSNGNGFELFVYWLSVLSHEVLFSPPTPLGTYTVRKSRISLTYCTANLGLVLWIYLHSIHRAICSPSDHSVKRPPPRPGRDLNPGWAELYWQDNDH